MAEQYRRPYLDSNVYIWTIVGPNAPVPDPDKEIKHRVSADILELAQRGSFLVSASTFIEAEVIKDPHSPALSAKQEERISGFFERSFFVWVEVDRLIAQKARQLAREHAWKPPDAIHVATALRAECDQLLTWDGPMRKEQDCYTVEALRICKPHAAGWQTTLTEPEKI